MGNSPVFVVTDEANLMVHKREIEKIQRLVFVPSIQRINSEPGVSMGIRSFAWLYALDNCPGTLRESLWYSAVRNGIVERPQVGIDGEVPVILGVPVKQKCDMLQGTTQIVNDVSNNRREDEGRIAGDCDVREVLSLFRVVIQGGFVGVEGSVGFYERFKLLDVLYGPLDLLFHGSEVTLHD
jgi:hypothetical protein